MAPPGTIIGQIQTTPTQPAAIPQVAASPTQLQTQLQANSPQTITLSTPQQVALPPTVPQVKDTSSQPSTEEGTQNSDGLKENGVDGKTCLYIMS